MANGRVIEQTAPLAATCDKAGEPRSAWCALPVDVGGVDLRTLSGEEQGCGLADA